MSNHSIKYSSVKIVNMYKAKKFILIKSYKRLTLFSNYTEMKDLKLSRQNQRLDKKEALTKLHNFFNTNGCPYPIYMVLV